MRPPNLDTVFQRFREQALAAMSEAEQRRLFALEPLERETLLDEQVRPLIVADCVSTPYGVVTLHGIKLRVACDRTLTVLGIPLSDIMRVPLITREIKPGLTINSHCEIRDSKGRLHVFTRDDVLCTFISGKVRPLEQVMRRHGF